MKQCPPPFFLSFKALFPTDGTRVLKIVSIIYSNINIKIFEKFIALPVNKMLLAHFG